MNFMKRWVYLAAGLGMIILLFIATSLFDIVLSVFYARFYTTAAFVVTFGVGGVFGTVCCYMQAIKFAPVKNEFTRWTVIIVIWVASALFIFPLSVLEGGEYQAAFIAYGIAMALSTLLFIKGRIEI